MHSIKDLYKNHIYGVMGTLIFHILIFAGLWFSEIKTGATPEKQEEVLLNFVPPPPTPPEKEKEEPPEKDNPRNQAQNNSKTSQQEMNMGTNHGVNDAMKRDKFFDDSYKRDIEDAEKMVDKVNKQLSKKIPQTKQFAMPEAVTEGQSPDSIKNTIYSGKSNIHYYLENRFHVRLPIPVFLAKGGGLITIDIQVDRDGQVIKATARSATNINDPMLPVYATQAAERTVFNADAKAPSVQKGTITYRFVPQ
jgi:hypothetical protein